MPRQGGRPQLRQDWSEAQKLGLLTNEILKKQIFPNLHNWPKLVVPSLEDIGVERKASVTWTQAAPAQPRAPSLPCWTITLTTLASMESAPAAEHLCWAASPLLLEVRRLLVTGSWINTCRIYSVLLWRSTWLFRLD